jgi:superfamily I DNA/RNA helicase
VVGDDDQSIYSFRGASHVVFSLFKKSFTQFFYYYYFFVFEILEKSYKECTLSVNYRSSNNIVQISRSLIDSNKFRINKDLRLLLSLLLFFFVFVVRSYNPRIHGPLASIYLLKDAAEEV